MSFRRRNFPEVLDRLLVSTVKGVAAEEHAYPPAATEPYRHDLLVPPARQLVSLFGMRDGTSHLFRAGSDYQLSADQRAVEWLADGERPDHGSVISVNYLPQDSSAQLNDLHVGSVARTLAESIGLEIARLYAQLEAVYQSGFIDTASASALDKLVALLGVERVQGGFPAGELEFRRAAGAQGAITIPAGTRVLDVSGEVEYQTVNSVTLAPNQQQIRVAARDLERNAFVPANSLTVLAIPIAGIASVSNPAPTAINTEQESDGQLRNRAKNFLHGSERATLGSLRNTIARQQVGVEVVESTSTPGLVEYTLHADAITPELEQRILAAVESTRPAGVRVQPSGLIAPTAIDVSLRLITRKDALEADLRAVQHQVQQILQDYFKRLPVKEDGRVNQLIGPILGIALVEDVELIDVTLPGGSSVLNRVAGSLALQGFPTELGELEMADPNLPTRLDLIVRFPETETVPDETSIRQALGDTLAYLNDSNAEQPLTESAVASLSYGKWLWVLPLPGHPGQQLETFDTDGGSLPTAAELAPYEVVVSLTQEGGLTRELQADGDLYQLMAQEQLALSSVSLQAEATDA